MKALMFYLLLTINVNAGMVDETKPTVLFVNQNPMSAYYGDPAASVMSFYLPDHNIVSLYVNLDFGESSSSFIYQTASVAKEINELDPESIFIHGSGLYSAVRDLFPDKRIIVFSMEPSSVNIVVDSPGPLLDNLLKQMEFRPARYYILSDNSSKSIRAARLYTAMLKQIGIRDLDISVERLTDMYSLERRLRALNSEPRSILINCMYQLNDVETGVVKYIPDIKQILHMVNTKHLELGSYRTPDSNESIVFQIDYSRVPSFFRNNLSTPVKIKVLFNIDRLDRLGYKSEYMRTINMVDGIIK